MGVREFLADKWARLKAWARSVPPDVWIGLAIGFVTLLVIWMTYKKSGNSNSASTSTDNPIVGDTSPGSLTTIPGLSSSANPPSAYSFPDLTQLWTQNSNLPPITTSPHAVQTPDTGYMSTLNQNELNGQNAVIAAIAQAAAATKAFLNNASPLDETTIAQTIQPKPIVNPFLAAASPIDETQIARSVQSSSLATTSYLQAASPLDESSIARVTAPAPAPAPIPITQHYTILSSPAYAPIKAAKNDIGIY